MPPPNEQEAFWQGEFGNAYTERNRGTHWVAANAALFARVLSRTGRVDGVLELGANIGLNLMALRTLLPESRLSAVEINATAAAELARNVPGVELTRGSILDVAVAPGCVDLAFTKGVLIHIAPGDLPAVYDRLHAASRRWVLVCEYYDPRPVEVPYRGHAGKLFKRDFAGDLLDRFTDLRLVDYGFVYRRDPLFPQDDMTWFLMEKVRP